MKPINGELFNTGGNYYVGWGQIDEGNWFMADYEYDGVRIVNANPDEAGEDAWYEEWQKEHLVKDFEDEAEETIMFLYEFLRMEGSGTARILIDGLKMCYPKFFEENYCSTDARSIGLQIKELLKDNNELLFIGSGGMIDGKDYDLEYELTNGKTISIYIKIE